MLSSRGHAELSHFVERLAMVLHPNDLPLALDLLTQAAVTGSLALEAIRVLSAEYAPDRPRRIGFLTAEGGAAAPGIGEVRDILDIFEHDGYLENKGGQYVFVSSLVRDWWRARFGFGFVEAGQRMPRR